MRLIKPLMLSFFIGATAVFFEAAASALFLTKWGVEFIPYAYIAGAFIITFFQWLSSLQGIFLMLALIQGFFAGLVIGKLSEGEVLSGFKHSLILMAISFFLMTLAQGG